MKSSFRGLNGFSLIEVALALGVAAIGLVTILALLPVGLKTNQNATEQNASADILSAIANDLRATPATTPRGSAATSAQFSIPIPANPVSSSSTTTLYFTPAGQFSSSLQPESRYRTTISFLPNGTGTRTATFVNVKVTWPAAATLANAGGAAEAFIALDRN